MRQGEPLTIGAEAVFVCCGAIETPALLRRSRIKKNIGNTLAFYPMVKVVAVFEDEINSEPTDIGAQQVKEFSPHISMGCSISSLPYLALAMTDHPDARDKLRSSVATNEHLLRDDFRAHYRRRAQCPAFTGAAHPILFE